MNYVRHVEALGACRDALAWLRAERHLDLDAAWAACPRGDWMLWLAGRCVGPQGHPSRTPLVLAACECAEAALNLAPEGEDRPRHALETARAWARGEATVWEVRSAAEAAHAAYAHAAYAVNLQDDALARACFGAHAAAAAVYTPRTYAECSSTAVGRAAVVRRHLPSPPLLLSW